MTRLLVLNFFPAFYPPSSGGEQRYFHVYHHLSRRYDVTLLSPTFPHQSEEVVEFNTSFREHRIPKEQIHVELHRDLDAQSIGQECSALVCALAAKSETAYHRRYRALVPHADIVVHDSPFMVDYDEQLGKDGKPRVYNSYNVEASLMQQMLEGPHKARYVSLIGELEARLVGASKLVFATSNAEREMFVERYDCDPGKLAVAPNGFEPPAEDAPENELAPDRDIHAWPAGDARPLAIFLGSAHPPNVEAARFVCEVIAPALSRLRFAIAGSVCDRLGRAPENVRLLGLLSGPAKVRLFRRCAVALNPMFTGAGTNLKMLDFMSAGLSIVSTPVGARGLDVEDGRHCVVAARDGFAAAVVGLIEDPTRRSRLGDSARALAYERYTWRSIADGMHQALEALLRASSAIPHTSNRRRILVLNDFPVESAAAGGEVRIARLLAALAQWHDVTLLCLTDEIGASDRRVARGFREIAIPKTQEHRALQQAWNDRNPVSVSDIISAAMCAENARLVEAYALLAAEADVVVLEHPYLAPLLQTSAPPPHVIYEAFNVESVLKAAMLAPHPDRDTLVATVTAIEKKACADADRIVCVSDEDRKAFEAFGHRGIVVIQNGVDMQPGSPVADLSVVAGFFERRPVAVFLGSGHIPNIEAVNFIVRELAPASERVVFLIVGAAAHYFASREVPSNVLLCGRVEDDVKNVLLAVADVAVNPMLSGGGSSLKVPAYMAARLPVITTPIGIRGYDIVDGVHAIVAEPENFAAKLAALVEDAERQRLIGAHGYEYAAAHLDWQQLGARYRDVIDTLIGDDAAGRPAAAMSRPGRSRLLVVTYRFTEPPLGGAEAYLLATLKGLHALGDFDIDVATFAVQGIADHLHFSASYEPLGHRRDAFDFVRAVHRFAVDPVDETAVAAHCASLFELWQREDLRQARAFERDYEDSTLLGGWFHPERHGARFQRWTGPQAEIFLPTGINGVTIRGVAEGSKSVTLRGPRGTATTAKVRGEFVVELAAECMDGGAYTLTVDPARQSGGDPRRLGVCVTQITARRGTASFDVPLQADFGARMRQKDVARWVQSLIDITNAREMRDDERFLAVRGPHSARLDAWLRDHVADYDVVLAQGVPFSTSVIGARHARQQRVPCVVLPHFHMDDKYYHWREFYEAFRSADRVIAFPRPAKGLFFDRIGARAVSVQGGGVDAAEFENSPSGSRAFRALHPSLDPFVLVLGRKSGAKNYASVVAAVEAVNRTGTRLDLVMIGPDEDGQRLDSRHVHYLGSQPRAVVLGALAQCHCLATMSESESFGIVVVEAWMSGRPVVANGRNAASADLIEHGRNGLLCQTVDDVAAALKRLVEAPGEAARLGAAGRGEALAGYTWGSIAKAINDVLLSVCRTDRSRPAEEAEVRGPASLPA